MSQTLCRSVGVVLGVNVGIWQSYGVSGCGVRICQEIGGPEARGWSWEFSGVHKHQVSERRSSRRPSSVTQTNEGIAGTLTLGHLEETGNCVEQKLRQWHPLALNM